MRPVPALLIADGLLILISGWLFQLERDAAALATLGATGLLALCQIALFAALPSPGRLLRIDAVYRKPHWIQTPLQLLLYVYWGLYWGEVSRQVPFLLAQLVFAYGLEMLLSWLRFRSWRFGLGPVPVVLSLNLFLWMTDEYALLQFGLIALAYGGREVVTWQRAGRQRHIFNPSAFALALVSCGLIFFGSPGISRGVDIIGSFDLPPSFFEVVFLLGLVPQLVFLTTWTTFGAVAALAGLYFAVKWGAGIHLGPTPFDPSVFLGVTLLVTDPATSPESRSGRLLFGTTYVAGIFVLCIILRLLHVPSFYDKILMVPVVNLLVPWFDRAGPWLVARLTPAAVARGGPPAENRWGPVLLYAAMFLVILPPLKQADYSRRSPLPPPAADFSPAVSRQLVISYHLRRELPEVYQPFAFRAEWEHYDFVRSQLQAAVPLSAR